MWIVQVIDALKNEVVREIGPRATMREAEKMERGVLRNMDRSRFYTIVIGRSSISGVRP